MIMHTTVGILYNARYSRNSEAFLFPLLFNRRRLRECGIRLVFYPQITKALMECDVLCLSSKFFSTWWTKHGGMDLTGFLIDARRRVSKVVWFDNSDSTGVTHFKVLPYVDGYCKNQLLVDRSLYQNNYYGSRIFTDYIHQRFDVQDRDPGEPHLNQIPTAEELRKVQVGWNYGMANYGVHGEFLGKIWYRLHALPRWYARKWNTPSMDRGIQLSCRISASYNRKTVAFPRQEMRRHLEGKVSLERIPREVFIKELNQSIAALSPFGYGEVCYRDFELTVCGVAMIKQDMSHLETWPNLWRKDTYLPLKWDLSDFNEKIEYAIAHPNEMAERACAAQAIYKRALTTEEGHQEFCDRFQKLIRF